MKCHKEETNKNEKKKKKLKVLLIHATKFDEKSKY